jgi:GTP-binding protein HflX
MLQTAVIAARTDDGRPDTAEIRRLAEAAGARVVDELTQTRPEDPGTYLGSGAVADLAGRVDDAGADTVVVDDALSPAQTVALEDAVGAHVVDRQRVVLQIFADGARTERARTQAELARLRYRLPRLRERSDEGAMNRFTESGTPLYDVLDRIDALERKLDELPAVDAQHRAARREQGCDLVALAGYTNAGKSTLLRRLADDMALDDDDHPDIATTADTADRLFETLNTTTRRTTLGERSALVTDTVGFLEDLPHPLVESFGGTLRAARAADVVVVVADVSLPAADLRRRLATALDAVPDDARTVTVLNKADAVDRATLAGRRAAVADLAPDPIAVSATEDDDLSGLVERVRAALPALEHATLQLPNSEAAMSLVSWLHDEATSVEAEYGAEAVTVAVRADESTVAKARDRAASLSATSATA